jgi:hypothetical protein
MGSFWAARYGKSISGKDLHDELDPSWRNIPDYTHLPWGGNLSVAAWVRQSGTPTIETPDTSLRSNFMVAARRAEATQLTWA